MYFINPFFLIADSVNYATGKTTTGDTNFNLNYYFLVPGDYNRAELVM